MSPLLIPHDVKGPAISNTFRPKVFHIHTDPLVYPKPSHSSLYMRSSLFPTPSLDASIREVIKIIYPPPVFSRASINTKVSSLQHTPRPFKLRSRKTTCLRYSVEIYWFSSTPKENRVSIVRIYCEECNCKNHAKSSC